MSFSLVPKAPFPKAGFSLQFRMFISVYRHMELSGKR